LQACALRDLIAYGQSYKKSIKTMWGITGGGSVWVKSRGLGRRYEIGLYKRSCRLLGKKTRNAFQTQDLMRFTSQVKISLQAKFRCRQK
jgi:hypothetical protein